MQGQPLSGTCRVEGGSGVGSMTAAGRPLLPQVLVGARGCSGSLAWSPSIM